MRLHERASHELYVSQPALSSSVKELENELGIEIFTVPPKGIALTVDGAEFLTYARRVLDQASLLENVTRTLTRNPVQTAVLRVPHSVHVRRGGVRGDDHDSTKSDEYEFTIRGARTKDIINQVANMLSGDRHHLPVRLQQRT